VFADRHQVRVVVDHHRQVRVRGQHLAHVHAVPPRHPRRGHDPPGPRVDRSRHPDRDAPQRDRRVCQPLDFRQRPRQHHRRAVTDPHRLLVLGEQRAAHVEDRQ
jgi:hypothetical protein